MKAPLTLRQVWLKVKPRIEFICLRATTIPNHPDPKINEKITAAEVRVLGNDGKNVGVFSTSEALRMAREEGLDLIEISPNAKPPVVRIMSYDKYRYLEEKAEKKEKQAQKSAGMKTVQISARAADHDLQISAKRLMEFLEEGHQIEIQMRLRGREKGNRPWAEERLKHFLSLISTEFRMINPPRFGGRGMMVQVMKKG